MAELFQKTVTRRRADGTTYTSKTKTWYARFPHPEGGGRRPIEVATGSRQFSAAKIIGDDAEMRACLAANGRGDPFEPYLKIRLAKHLEDWESYLHSKGCTGRYINMKLFRARAVIDGCRFEFWRDITSASVMNFLGRLRTAGVERKVEGVVKLVPTKSRTRAFYLDAIKAFTRWLHQERRVPHDPLLGLKKETVIDESEGGAFDPEELGKLLEVTEGGPVRFGMSGFERRCLYQLAADTGLRNNEARTLTWGCLQLDGKTPQVVVIAKHAKARKEARLPLRKQLVKQLVKLKAESPDDSADALVFYSSKDGARLAAMLRADMKAAGIEEQDANGRPRNFHSLRHSFATALDTADIPLRTRMALMRHCDARLTLRRYSHRYVADLAEAVEQLPDRKPAATSKRKQRGTA